MPYFAFPGCENDPTIMAKGMDKIAKPYNNAPMPQQLPIVKGLRYALNVAACDRRPVVVIQGTEAERKHAKEKLATISWQDEFIGQFVFTEQDGPASVEIVQPDSYGVKGTVLAKALSDQIEPALKDAITKFKTWANDHRVHLSEGAKNGIRWRPAVPVEDKQADLATKRLWGG
ncbi:MAG: hypothetical protein ABL949_13270 [Fimbriimonadaceae bacterium]